VWKTAFDLRHFYSPHIRTITRQKGQELDAALTASVCALKDKLQALNARKWHERLIVALEHKMLVTFYTTLSQNWGSFTLSSRVNQGRQSTLSFLEWINSFLAFEGVRTLSKTKNPTTATGSESSMSTEAKAVPIRVIKKYPNRRLYDTDTSTYITLTDIRHLVMEGVIFVVRDAKSSEDLTRSILLQIILEEETGGAPMFTEAVLANIIRFYGNAMQGFMGAYLEKNVESFMDLQVKMSEQSKGMSPETWAQLMKAQSPMMQGMMGTYVEQSKTLFTQMQEQMQQQSEQMLTAFGLKR
jgi:polyhydroxyalkanoate synthesis repressor PhaR